MEECTSINKHTRTKVTSPGSSDSPPQLNSDPKFYDLLSHLGQTPIELGSANPNLCKDKVVAYLQNLNPMSKGEHILDYWKLCVDISPILKIHPSIESFTVLAPDDNGQLP
ncbi:hypothetical protein O181_007729 [Austropuccinia psidii MF-1]|uniref:Uncharacterized protein n=1 Tax=Austropuccinia psidii MF-1 TaxID=1389203 RepID=A0A9Q3BLF0_9BASI|nr:hypothetical protein [Austropuccinia psidii MF-1]